MAQVPIKFGCIETGGAKRIFEKTNMYSLFYIEKCKY